MEGHPRPPLGIWVINLDDAPERFERTVAPLRRMPDVEVHRFPALRPDRNAQGLTAISSAAPDKTLAIALSHRAVAKTMAEEKERGPVLVLEDDTFPQVRSLRASVDECISKAKPGWDIILLNTAGPGCDVCEGERPGRLCGSTAAYLLSPGGACKLASAVVSWHADVVRNSDAYDIRQGPALFGTADAEPTGLIVGGRDVLWYAQQPCLRWGSSSSAVRVWVVFLFAIACICGMGGSATLSTKGRGCASVLLGMPAAMALAGITALVWHSSRDANFVRCSKDSLALLAVVLCLQTVYSAWGLARGVCPALSVLCLFGTLVALMLTAFWWDDQRTTQACAKARR